MFRKKYCFFLLIFFLCSLLNAEAVYKNLGVKGIKRPEVEALRQKYLTTHQKWLYDVLDEAEPYRIYVRKELSRRKMPLILEYLPVVESNYIPTAKSRSGATGMWQFMTNSVKPFMECDEYVDQRLDPWISTDAALSKLQDNYRKFNDWLLAITAYNCGAGALERAIKKAGKNDFWYLRDNNFLSAQASDYVPKLLAIADVSENDAWYGTKFPDARDADGKTLKIRSDAFDYVTVKNSVSIKYLADELRIDEKELKKLNLALVKDVTPPHKEYKIRLPEGMKDYAEYILRQSGNSAQ